MYHLEEAFALLKWVAASKDNTRIKTGAMDGGTSNHRLLSINKAICSPWLSQKCVKQLKQLILALIHYWVWARVPLSIQIIC